VISYLYKKKAEGTDLLHLLHRLWELSPIRRVLLGISKLELIQIIGHLLRTSFSSIPRHSPSTSAEWIRNSLSCLQIFYFLKKHLWLTCKSLRGHWGTLYISVDLRKRGTDPDAPLDTSIFVMFCHLFVATSHLSPFFRQLICIECILSPVFPEVKSRIPHIYDESILTNSIWHGRQSLQREFGTRK